MQSIATFSAKWRRRKGKKSKKRDDFIEHHNSLISRLYSIILASLQTKTHNNVALLDVRGISWNIFHGWIYMPPLECKKII
jgi:hypothetical protein